jgi:hypothetical protein
MANSKPTGPFSMEGRNKERKVDNPCENKFGKKQSISKGQY